MGSPTQQAVAALLLAKAHELSRYEQRDRLVASLSNAGDHIVMASAISALGEMRDELVLSTLLAYCSSPDHDVRHAVSDAVSRCAGGQFDLVKSCLVSLAADVDHETAWSATFELGQWLIEKGDTETYDLPREVARTHGEPDMGRIAAEALEQAELTSQS